MLWEGMVVEGRVEKEECACGRSSDEVLDSSARIPGNLLPQFVTLGRRPVGRGRGRGHLGASTQKLLSLLSVPQFTSPPCSTHLQTEGKGLHLLFSIITETANHSEHIAKIWLRKQRHKNVFACVCPRGNGTYLRPDIVLHRTSTTNCFFTYYPRISPQERDKSMLVPAP